MVSWQQQTPPSSLRDATAPSRGGSGVAESSASSPLCQGLPILGERDGDVMVGGWNFGCGSSREHAPVAIKAAGISVVIAKSFARIFYRNSINIGLPIMECPEAVDAIEAGDTVRVDFDTGVITDETGWRTV